MTRTVWKFPLAMTDSQMIEAPGDFEPLSVQMQHGVACLWAIVSPSLSKESHNIWIHGDGHIIQYPGHLRFVGTVQVGPGEAYHVFHALKGG
jgi:hypothetical protein